MLPIWEPFWIVKNFWFQFYSKYKQFQNSPKFKKPINKWKYPPCCKNCQVWLTTHFITSFDSAEASSITHCMRCVEHCRDLFNKWLIKKNISETGEIISKQALFARYSLNIEIPVHGKCRFQRAHHVKTWILQLSFIPRTQQTRNKIQYSIDEFRFLRWHAIIIDLFLFSRSLCFLTISSSLYCYKFDVLSSR